MTPEQWRRVKAFSAAVMERPPDEQAACLSSLCQGDTDLEREVLALLEAASRADRLFEGPLLAAPEMASALRSAMHSPTLEAGARVGAYRIVREIGRGGMGTVYLAERADDEYSQRVALKLADVRSDAVLSWFRDERQTLASLEHPNIARLTDGGTMPDGVPYLIMEFVDGPPIDEYCATRQLDIEPRLRLFKKVCAAVDLANRHLIVHRDLKPRNILVADDEPKLLDFGIATVLESSRDQSGKVTGTNSPNGLMTPLYASPEQLNGDPITTATDVYALGVLLHRLLTDHAPYEVTGGGPGALSRAICEQEPLRPSACAQNRSWRHRLAGDLDAIVLKAMRKDPNERYGSAAALATDIERYLAGRPVEACGERVGYRAGKFIRRNLAASVASALVIIALVAGLGLAVWQQRQTEHERQRAQHHFDSVRQLASSLIFEVHDRIEDLPGSIPARQLLVSRAIEYFDGLAAEERNNLPLQRELAAAYEKLGTVLGRPFRSNLGDSAAALASYRKALAIRQQLAEARPDDRDIQLELWSNYHMLGDMLREAVGTREALENDGRASELSSRLQRQWPDDPAVLRVAGQTEVMRQRTFLQSGAIEDLRRSIENALAIDERLLGRQPANQDIRNDIASLHGRMAVALLKLGQPAAALPHAQQRLAMATVVSTASAREFVQTRRARSAGLLQVAQVLARTGDVAALEQAQREALDLRRAIAAEDPTDRQSTIDLMVAHLEIGDLLLRRREAAKAVGPLRDAVDLSGRLVDADPHDVFVRLSRLSTLVRLATALHAAGSSAQDEAVRLIGQAIGIARSAVGADPEDARFQFELSQALAVKGDLESDAHRLGVSEESGAPWYEESLAILRKLRDAGRLAGGTLNGDEPARMAEIENKLRGL